MSEHTPTTQEVRAAYVMARYETEHVNNPQLYAEFDRWLNAEMARAWDEGASTARPVDDWLKEPAAENPYRD